ncbi:Fibroblast growth factor receptor substrate 2 [Chelonia mydas]|uniref:T-complex protein 1 subunit beta n=4 Tax=Amniota TaxID=32524 RepID=M7BXC5_CHEMY|nr:Fibroblast growth factor receptor substrate 2 [Chelonia mydas]
MGSCCSCPDKETVPDNHRNKFKVINVDDDGNELGSGVMELTDTELILYTRKRDSVKWHYLCLRRYGYDSNLFSFESGRRCQTGQGIFAFKCARAEELFNMLQEIMQNNSINVVEEPVVERNHHQTELEVPRTPRTPTTPGFSAQSLPNGYPRYPSFGDASSHPSSRHPSVGSARLPSVGEESTHPLLVAEEQVHTYVNTTGVQEERKNRSSVHVPLELRLSNVETSKTTEDQNCTDDRDAQVLLEPEGVKFVLGPTPVQRQLMEREQLEQLGRDQVSGSSTNNSEWDTGYDSDERKETHCGNKLVYENLNRLSIPSASGVRRGRLTSTSTSDTQNINNSAQRRTALLNYENLPSLPPVWEARKLSRDEDDNLGPKTPSLNGYHNNLDPMHNYVNTENVTVPASAHKVEFTRRRDCTPTVFNFDIRRPSLEHRQLNYIQVDLEGGSDSDNPQTPKTPTTPLPQTPTRRTELYAVIDIERTAAMSSLQKALPRDDATYSYKRNDESLSDACSLLFQSSFIGAIAIGDLVKSTLGPKGMDKILLSTGRDGTVTVTNDGATILKSIGVDNPAAKVLVDMSMVQDDEVGDGTTSVTVVAAELLREAEALVAKKIHPQTIIAGWREATKAAREALLKSAVDHGDDEIKFREDLMNIAGTTLSSKLLTHHKDHFTKLAVEAVLRLKGSGNLEAIHIIKKLGGSLVDSYLDEGFLLDKKIGVNQPKRIENAKILIANTGMDTDKIKVFGSRVRVDSTAKVAEIEQAEKEKMKEKVERILKHGINCFINRQLIYNYPEQLFGAAGVMAIEHADFAGVERLALVTGGEIASTFDHPELVKLGSCKLIEEVLIGEDKLIHFSGVAMELGGRQVAAAGQGSSSEGNHAEVRVAIPYHAILPSVLLLAVVLSSELGSQPAAAAALRLPNSEVSAAASRNVEVKVAIPQSPYNNLAIALWIPTIIADNAGYDSADLVSQLRAAHSEGKTTYGLDMKDGVIGDMATLGITESFQVKRQVLLSAAEAAEMILRVDDIIKAAPSKIHPCGNSLAKLIWCYLKGFGDTKGLYTLTVFAISCALNDPLNATDIRGLANRGSHWLQFAAPGQWGKRRRPRDLLATPSCSPHWLQTVNWGQWELPSAEPVDVTDKPAQPAGGLTLVAHVP